MPASGLGNGSASAGIGYEPAEKPKSDLYRDLLPLINARRIDLLDDKRLLAQLCGLERRAELGLARTASIMRPTVMTTSPTAWRARWRR